MVKHKTPIICQVPDCQRNLSRNREYNIRYRICPYHAGLRSMPLEMDGETKTVRFCQQCGRFQPIEDFDEEKKTCRTKLAMHNEQRKKARRRYGTEIEQQPEPKLLRPTRTTRSLSRRLMQDEDDSYDHDGSRPADRYKPGGHRAVAEDRERPLAAPVPTRPQPSMPQSYHQQQQSAPQNNGVASTLESLISEYKLEDLDTLLGGLIPKVQGASTTSRLMAAMQGLQQQQQQQQQQLPPQPASGTLHVPKPIHAAAPSVATDNTRASTGTILPSSSSQFMSLPAALQQSLSSLASGLDMSHFAGPSTMTTPSMFGGAPNNTAVPHPPLPPPPRAAAAMPQPPASDADMVASLSYRLFGVHPLDLPPPVYFSLQELMMYTRQFGR